MNERALKKSLAQTENKKRKNDVMEWRKFYIKIGMRRKSEWERKRDRERQWGRERMIANGSLYNCFLDYERENKWVRNGKESMESVCPGLCVCQWVRACLCESEKQGQGMKVCLCV